jgi:hypothetical protein
MPLHKITDDQNIDAKLKKLKSRTSEIRKDE